MKKSESTRLLILKKAFELIYAKGFQATSVDDIIAQVEVTKGAFFYHFKNKDEMGLAVIQELMEPAMYESFVKPLQRSQDPVMDIYAMMKALLFESPELQVQYGCPAGNLTQEMSPLNSGFKAALDKLVTEMQNALASCIINGQSAGTIRADVDPVQVAYFVMSGYWGIRNFGKVRNDTACYTSFLKELKVYLRCME